MLRIDTSDLQRAVRGIERAEKQLRFATAVAMTRTMNDARRAEVAEMRSVFDRPTPYIQNTLQVTPATKERLSAQLGFKEFGGVPGYKILRSEIRGGARSLKRFERLLVSAGLMSASERAVPGRGMSLDAYGNISGAQIKQMLSSMGASSDAFQNRNRGSRRRRKKYDYFVGKSSGHRAIFKRVGREIVPFVVFVAGASYRPRYPWYATAARVIPTAFRRHMRSTFRQYVLPELKRGAR